MTPKQNGVCARQISERDVAVLRWVGEQYAIPRDLLPVLLGRLSDDDTARAAGRVTATVVDRAVRRWRDLGLADTRLFLRGEAASVWATASGLRLAGLPWRPGVPSVVMLAHRHAVARVRAHVEGRDPTVAWICDRSLREGAKGRLAHLPDGVVETDRRRTAVEVELTPKTEERVRDILRILLGGYDRVAYFATPRAAVVLRRAGGEVPAGRLVIRPYPLAKAAAA